LLSDSDVYDLRAYADSFGIGPSPFRKVEVEEDFHINQEKLRLAQAFLQDSSGMCFRARRKYFRVSFQKNCLEIENS
jgi:hypothetical protein